MSNSPENVILGQPTVGEEELAAVAEVFRSGWLAGAGPACRRFEERFAAAVGTAHALATSNCGAALYLGLRVLDVRPGDEVVVADYTFPATGHAVLQAGATPVFADIRPDIFTADPAAVEAAITPRTVGILVVDTFGQPGDYDEYRVIADRHGLWLFEDAACAAGATYRTRPAGSLADLAAFSFHGRKGITAGEGGALVSDREDLIARARKLHTYGIEPAFNREGGDELPIPTFHEAGFNFRLSDVQAAIMNVQLDRLPDLLAARRSVAKRYSAAFTDLDGVEVPVELPDREHPWQAYAVLVASEIGRDRVATRLRARGIGCNFGTYASHLQPVYGEQPPLPVSADVFARQLALPMHANLTDAQVDRVVTAVREVVTELS
ncbi:dTDP-4-amino-4,6-dideoxygalactose transaminase [Amycolatopsis arida]|uniref:dTDP-4-amino-4,6-dideoxygalactose transaminase n=1 Tax=Amycolatopsis arida TaxID=587909 RepID=A0A1I5YLT2_9PSEU|nr:DegT/DnrJ/EryC1/StrS family aminotransferase [Amycolatopsis arida]TDX90611.1 dTDP-4-amino-4,6-dideoxygalactose transaminase [Amycolatopsis arida]SFQ45181.1 dTDP-4-amino-4,6-dideoxygalactose transaminase [Amycolatopsis arida]